VRFTRNSGRSSKAGTVIDSTAAEAANAAGSTPLHRPQFAAGQYSIELNYARLLARVLIAKF
jgi:hypothetical protein